MRIRTCNPYNDIHGNVTIIDWISFGYVSPTDIVKAIELTDKSVNMTNHDMPLNGSIEILPIGEDCLVSLMLFQYTCTDKNCAHTAGLNNNPSIKIPFYDKKNLSIETIKKIVANVGEYPESLNGDKEHDVKLLHNLGLIPKRTHLIDVLDVDTENALVYRKEICSDEECELCLHPLLMY